MEISPVPKVRAPELYPDRGAAAEQEQKIMGLRERLEQHWFVVTLVVVAVAVGTTWSVLNEVLVRPRDEEFARLQRRLSELEAKQSPPYAPELKPSDSLPADGNASDPDCGTRADEEKAG